MKTLLIDNYDSYTHILGHYIWKISGEKPLTIKNDALSLEEIKQLKFDNIVISPGPGNPHNASDTGVCSQVLQAFTHIPVLGVCLGHQAMGVFAGAHVGHAPQVKHGKHSHILHNGIGLFQDIPNGFMAVRYHSLVIQKDDMPDTFEVIATSEDDDQIMGIKLKLYPYFGVQFHPESIGTDYGERILKNFLGMSQEMALEKRISVSAKPNNQVYYRKLSWLDPQKVFEHVYQGCPQAIWLDSSKEENSAFSYMGTTTVLLEINGDNVLEKEIDKDGNQKLISSRTGDVFSLIRQRTSGICLKNAQLPFPFSGGLVGYFGYEFGNKDVQEYGESAFSDYMPDACLMDVRSFIAFNHNSRDVYCVCVKPDPGTAEKELADLEAKIKACNNFNEEPAIQTSKNGIPDSDLLFNDQFIKMQCDKKEYKSKIAIIKKKIRDGETYEVCLTNGFSVEESVNPWELYKILRHINPAPFSAFLKTSAGSILSSSPESFIRLNKNRVVITEPIKGTRHRGTNSSENLKLRNDLLMNTKDASELLMITDLLRNDLALACKPGTVKVEELKKISEYASVLQLSSKISGELQDESDGIDLLQCVFPGGSITGAPKIRTMKIIQELEKRRRGVYTGCIGYLGFDGTINLNISIRTMVATKHKLTFGAGGAIVDESDPESEWQEVLTKARPMAAAIGQYVRVKSNFSV